MEETEPDVHGPILGAAAFNMTLSDRMFGAVARARETLSAHFTGGSADMHELSVRASSRATLAVQEAVTSIGAAVVGQATARGRVSATIVAATELRLAPTVLPGSVVLEMRHRHTDDAALIESEEKTLLDVSFDRLFDLLDAVQSDSDGTAVPSSVRTMGPRAAKHIFALCDVLASEGLDLDLGWVTSEGDDRGSRLTSRGARYLRKIAEDNSTFTSQETVTGILQTASVDESQKLSILTDEGNPMRLEAAVEIRDALARFYNSRVVCTVLVTETWNSATGQTVVVNTLTDIDFAPR